MTPKHLLRHRAAWLPRPGPDTPPALKAWLSDPGSLTARIRARCREFSVAVQFQGLAPLAQDERGFWGLRQGAHALVREVVLQADSVPVVFARSLILPRHARGAWPMFNGLGTRPLGAVLFADPCVARGTLHVKKLAQGDYRVRRMPATLAPSVALWARRSAFLRHGSVLLVTELFLPSIARLSP